MHGTKTKLQAAWRCAWLALIRCHEHTNRTGASVLMDTRGNCCVWEASKHSATHRMLKQAQSLGIQITICRYYLYPYPWIPRQCLEQGDRMWLLHSRPHFSLFVPSAVLVLESLRIPVDMFEWDPALFRANFSIQVVCTGMVLRFSGIIWSYMGGWERKQKPPCYSGALQVVLLTCDITYKEASQKTAIHNGSRPKPTWWRWPQSVCMLQPLLSRLFGALYDCFRSKLEIERILALLVAA